MHACAMWIGTKKPTPSCQYTEISLLTLYHLRENESSLLCFWVLLGVVAFEVRTLDIGWKGLKKGLELVRPISLLQNKCFWLIINWPNLIYKVLEVCVWRNSIHLELISNWSTEEGGFRGGNLELPTSRLCNLKSIFTVFFFFFLWYEEKLWMVSLSEWV